ncbi:hypothetical protein FA13DRAFT_1787883 [Coprinellus micaceus]|uniref:CSN8/PSMD8/EIF3K domain-containing protein n=1 Tax=Coprinellus micaceus TaxID=71717 RepID=A0A4Y7TQJ6_COPMI|nr:hypothetical protein FA13DRAFT_1787883 [Coprinellus micaceus]
MLPGRSHRRQRQATQGSQPSGNTPDSYQLRFPTVVDAVSRSDYDAVTQIAEEIDLNAVSDRQNSRLLAIAPLVLVYLIQNQTPPARYALARLSESHAAHPLINLLTSLLAFTTTRDHRQVYGTGEKIVDLVSQADFFHQEFGLVLTKLTTVFIEQFRRRTFELISKAYSSLPRSLAEKYLGASGEAIVAEAAKNGWEYDSGAQLLKPNASTAREERQMSSSSLSSFVFIANSVGKLEA